MAKATIILSIVTVFQFVSMAFLIIGSITAPVFRQIGLSKYNDITYGVFGYCDNNNNNDCSKASASYNPSQFQTNNDNWTLNNHSRNALGKILIVTPIAAGLNFFSFLSSFISIIIVTLQSNNTFSAVLFFFNLLFTLFGFLSAALICIVVFLLFYPNVTWCSWILIPAAALPLINLPIIFLGYFNNKNDNEDDLDYTNEDDHLLTKKTDTGLNNTNVYTEKNLAPTVLPSFQSQSNNYSNSNTDLYHKNTLLTNSTTDVSSNPYLEKKEYYSTSTIEKNSTPGLSSGTDPVSDNNARESEEEEERGKGKEDMEGDIDTKKDSFVAFSAIDNDAAPNKTNSFSINSSNLLNKNLNKNPSPTKTPLQGMHNQPSPTHGTLQNIQQQKNNIDNMSDFTPTSQGPINPNYYGSANNITNPNTHNSNMSQNLPYPHSPNGTSSIYMQSPQRFQYQQPQQWSNFPPQNYQQPTNQYLQPMVPQQRFPQYQQRHNPIAQNPSQMILQNNPNFMPQPRNMGVKKRYGNYPTMPNANQSMYRGPNHFQNAYKMRMADRNNMYNNLHSQSGNPYGFR